MSKKQRLSNSISKGFANGRGGANSGESQTLHHRTHMRVQCKSPARRVASLAQYFKMN